MIDQLGPDIDAHAGVLLNAAGDNNGLLVCEVAFDADFEYYQLNGSSVSATATDINEIINLCSAIYERDCLVQLIVTSIIVRENEPDPYFSDDPFELMGEFRNEWRTNQTGVPRDIAHLSMRIIRDFPEYYTMFAEKNFTYNKIKQGNRNPLLYRDSGADGLKTGHTEASGYGLAASAKRNGRRVVLVLNGLTSVRQRSSESLRLIDWAFRAFDNYALFQAGDTVSDAEVWLGKSQTVPLVIESGLVITMPRKARRQMKVAITYEGPVPAPIARGQPLARLFAGEEASQAGREKLLGAIRIADEKPTVGPLVLDRIA